MIYIVSGFYKSGTSALMNVMKSVGFQLVFDQEREDFLVSKTSPDRSFYEHKEYSWGLIEEPNLLDGKCIKVFANHIEKILDLDCQMIFIERDRPSREQSVFSGPLGKQMRETEDEEIRLTEFARENFDCLFLNFNSLIDDTENEILKLKSFLQMDFDVEEISQAVNKNLRNIVVGE
jgi:hypothetical protein